MKDNVVERNPVKDREFKEGYDPYHGKCVHYNRTPELSEEEIKRSEQKRLEYYQYCVEHPDSVACTAPFEHLLENKKFPADS
ncbi:MAG: hypothetical protein LBD41_02240 [Clostridiales Family XIII bacterium]|jgi:hypothetical protein|nr:hypothetical protein [Clostridiales Family XIII bacterium]